MQVVTPLTTRPCEDGAVFPQDRSPMANHSTLPRWLKSVFPSLSVVSIYKHISSGQLSPLPSPQQYT
ncbi:unnamed protein product [Ectocarpus sp. 12 AP-2014]